VLAERLDASDSADPVWNCWNETDKDAPWYERIVELSIATGIPLLGFSTNKSLKQKIDTFKAKIERGEIFINETPKEKQQRKRIRELEVEIEQLKRAKRLSEETKKGDDPKIELINIITNLQKDCKSSQFPKQCFTKLNQIINLIEMVNVGTKATFGLKFETKEGKSLQKILLIAGAMNLDQHVFEANKPRNSNSWLSFVQKIKNTNQTIKMISFKSLIQYKNSIKYK
jgi:hypothetical protein